MNSSRALRLLVAALLFLAGMANADQRSKAVGHEMAPSHLPAKYLLDVAAPVHAFDSISPGMGIKEASDVIARFRESAGTHVVDVGLGEKGRLVIHWQWSHKTPETEEVGDLMLFSANNKVVGVKCEYLRISADSVQMDMKTKGTPEFVISLTSKTGK